MRKYPVYESWQPDSAAPVPQRTYLYHLQPMGVGSMFVEGLTSFISRVSEAHSVSPAMLLNRELLPRMGTASSSWQQKARVPKNSTFIYQSHVLNGAGESAQHCVQVLENLTGSANLRVMTLLRLAGVLWVRNLLRTKRAWCPCCLEDWRCSGCRIYEPLLWALDPVTCCPTHRCALSVQCPHCGQSLHTLSARSRPGYCCRCRQWLGQPCLSEQSSVETSAGLATAYGIGALLAGSAEDKSFSSDLFRENLRLCIEYLTDGNVSRFCVATGMTYDKAAHWLSPGRNISLELLISVSAQLGLSPLRFLSETLTNADFEPARDLIARNTSHIRVNRSQARIDEELTCALHSEPPMSLHEVAVHLGYSSAISMRRRNPGICDQISTRYRKPTIRVAPIPLLPTVPSNNTIRRRLCSGLAANPRIPVKTIAWNLGFRNVVSLYKRFPDLCRGFAVANKAEKAKRLAPMREAFEAALTENPPPTIRMLAVRLRCTEAVLKYRFPELQAALLKRLPERTDFIKAQLIKLMQRASIEEPPPSVKVVAERAARSAGHLRAIDRGLCKIIRERHYEQTRADGTARRDAFRVEIAHAVVELLHRGLTPSRRKVTAAIPNPSLRNSHIVDQQIATTLREIEASSVNNVTGDRF